MNYLVIPTNLKMARPPFKSKGGGVQENHDLFDGGDGTPILGFGFWKETRGIGKDKGSETKE